ncbi:alpha-galactosidase [Butyribacter intestini]|uniref:alpha-galactosidase n=1 Tax=Butyribacter intestini TaxID=1703332 RepID=UPI0022E63839|nr:alpha-galactosidase [Butyribacter intestini]
MIVFDGKENIFKIDTENNSYVMGIIDEKYLVHIYYGKKLSGTHLAYLLDMDQEYLNDIHINYGEKSSFLDRLTMEYPTAGMGDFRQSCIEAADTIGKTGVELFYDSYKIIVGKPALDGLPATFGDGAQTLCITLKDDVLKLEVELRYSVFEGNDAVIRSAVITNYGDKPLYIEKVLSACLELGYEPHDYITLHGSWARERRIDRQRVGFGCHSVESSRGISSHQEHPFMAVVSEGATQETGDVYAMNFVYSGNFVSFVEKAQFGTQRFGMGINPNGFCWKLEAGESFAAPEVVTVYSDAGLDKMTSTFHDLYREHLIRKSWVYSERPVLINNWEGTYFDFDEKKIFDIAKEASKHGIEMLVLDDGWFGKRNDDRTSLGDWVVNEDKLKGGLRKLVNNINSLGMKFGIWFEPEMISPESELYKKHPDWAVHIEGREPGQVRNQLILDLSNREVVEYVYESVARILRSANIEYVKWDMNRPFTDVGSNVLDADRQGEIMHRHTLAVYELQGRLLKEFPYLLLENCSSGGARFDPGMLYFSPQIWCSDDTDAIERLAIQESTALMYPLSVIGAHVSDCPNHTVGRVTPFETRGVIAMAGTFGYELDVTKIPEEDRNMIASQVETYKKYCPLIQTGDYYRIASYQSNHYFDCYEIVSKDKSEAIVVFVQVLAQPNMHSRCVKLKGLDFSAKYETDGKVYDADALMNGGFIIKRPWGDFKAEIIHLQKCRD